MSTSRPASLFFRATALPASLGLLVTAFAPGCGALSGPGFDWNADEATVKDVRNVVKSGIVSCEKMVERYQLLHDSFDPELHAIVSWNDHLRDDAVRLDKQPKGERGSFFCVPLVVKDNVDVAGMPTTGGATALANATTGTNAAIVDRLLGAGAIVLGKSNLPDFALDGTNTVSSFGGQTVNPYDHALTVYGSSGGSAAAIGASLGIIGIGSDTYGSLVQPSSATGLVAIRATQGLVPMTGVLPLMSLQDVAGPMTRTVEDAAATLELLVDRTQADKGSQNYTGNLSDDGLRGLRIGFDPALLQPSTMPPMTPSPAVQALFTQTLGNLQNAGAVTKQVDALATLFPTVGAAVNSSFSCMPVDFKESLEKYLQTQRPESPKQRLGDILKSGQFDPSARSFLENAGAQTDSIMASASCQQYLADRAAAHDAITALLDHEGLDLLIYPVANQPAFAIGKPTAGWYGFQALSSNSGLPSLTMPMGIPDGSAAPVGFILLGRSYAEAKLVQAAYAYQQRVSPRQAPITRMN